MRDLTKGNIYKTFLFFAIPLVLAGFLSQAYSIIDTMIAGKILDYTGLASIGSTSAVIEFFTSTFCGFGMGFSIYAARLFGAKEYKKLKSAIYINYVSITAVILILSIIIVLFKNQLFDFLAIDPSIREGSGVYFCIYMMGSAFLIMNSYGVYLMNAFGSSVYPLVMSVLSTFLHIFGNIFAVKVLNLGIGGVAASTVFSAVIVDICYFIYLKKCFKKMGVDKYKVKFEIKTIKYSITYSLPACFQQMIMYFSSLVISPMVNAIGSSASAAYIICLKAYNINSILYWNSSKTLSNYISQSMGAGEYENIKKGTKVGFFQGILFLMPFLTASVVFAKQFCYLFLSSGSTGDVLDMSVTFLRYFMPFIVFNVVNNLFHAFFRGVAAMRFLVIATLVGSVSRIIASYVSIKYFAMNGVYIGWAVSWIVECIFSLTVYFTGLWKSDEIKNFELRKEAALNHSAKQRALFRFKKDN